MTDSNNTAKSTKKSVKCKNEKNIVISIILTESTASFLNMKIPHLEDISAEENEPFLCTILSNREVQNGSNKSRNPTEANKFYINEVVSDLGFFNSDENFEDNESLISDDEESESSPINSLTDLSSALAKKNSAILKEAKVFVRPLVTVRSIAHSDKINCEGNTIIVGLLDSDLTITDSGWLNVCRICHGGESSGNLLSPCRCRGSIALAHMECLERWLKESANSHCELCQHHFDIIRKPRYSVPWSILVFLRHPGEHFRDLLFDLFGFLIYTPSAITSTYMLMLLCESIAKANHTSHQRNLCGHVMVFSAIFGMAAIDFTYSSWLMVCLQRYREAWKDWYKNTCELKLILPEHKLRNYRQKETNTEEVE